MGPNGGLWKNLPAFNAYMTRVQSVLQSGAPSAEYLIYFPMHDIWHDGSEGLPLFTMHNQEKWLQPTSFYRTAMGLRKAGISYDFLSDRLLSEVTVQDHEFKIGGRPLSFIVVPETRYMPEASLRRLLDLAAQGGCVVFLGALPKEVPGFGNFKARQKSAADMIEEAQRLHAKGRDLRSLESVSFGKGMLWIARDVEGYFKSVNFTLGESLVYRKLSFIRRKQPDGWSYFIVNNSGKAFDEKIMPSKQLKSAVLFDPWTGRSGVAEVELHTDNPSVPNQKNFHGSIRLVLAPGESRIIRTYTDRDAEGPRWSDPEPTGAPIALTGTWKVSFLDGGPSLPPSFETSSLGSWTEQKNEAYRNFSGTALYRLEFDLKEKSPALLDLGEIANTAKVRLNGMNVGTCWSPPHRLDVGDLLVEGKNVLEVEVTNLAANRIADLDRRKVPWKAFHEINFVNIDYKNFDASGWLPLPSGLLGPVTLVRTK